MPPQAEVRRHPGYGTIYPDGVNGIRVVRTYTEGPKKKFYPDGTPYRTTPPPTIFELFGGGFCYASGQPVNKREDLENIGDPPMRARALKWFDEGAEISKKAQGPTRDPEKKLEPGETVFVVSSDLPREPDAVTGDLTKRQMEQTTISRQMSEISSGISSILEVVKAQGDRISLLEGKRTGIALARKKQAESLKKKWQDPDFRKAQEEKMRAARTKENADGTAKTDQTV